MESSAEYLLARWPRLAGVGALVRLLRECSDGNPLFLVNIVDYLAGAGAIAAVDGVGFDAVWLAEHHSSPYGNALLQSSDDLIGRIEV